MAKEIVPAEQLSAIRKLHEIEGQILRRTGYPYNLSKLEASLQGLVEGIGIREDLMIRTGHVLVKYGKEWPNP